MKRLTFQDFENFKGAVAIIAGGLLVGLNEVQTEIFKALVVAIAYDAYCYNESGKGYRRVYTGVLLAIGTAGLMSDVSKCTEIILSGKMMNSGPLFVITKVINALSY